MSKIKPLFLLLIVFPLLSFSQVKMKWNKEIPTKILWQEVTSLGNLIVSSREELIGVDTETGDISWGKRAFGNLERVAFEELPNSPFFSVTTGNSLHLIDQFTGNEVFNSKNIGLEKVGSYHLLYSSDAILVSGTDQNGEPLMVSVKMSDASLSWSMNEKFGRIVATNELDNQELLIVTIFNNYKLNANTGEVIWKKKNSKEAEQIDKMGKLGALFQQVAENVSENMDIKLHYYQPEGSEIFYLGSQKERQGGFNSSSGNATISYTNNYNAYDINDGSLVWNEELEVNGALSQVHFLDQGILVLPDDGNRTKINLFDYRNREGLWGKKGRGIAIKGGVYDYLDSGDGILLVSRTGNKDFLNYLDPKLGEITFEKPIKVDGTVVGIVPLANSILYITTESMNILDHQTGTLKWENSIRTNSRLTAMHQNKIFVFDYSTGLVKVVDRSNGEISDFSRIELRFEGKEVPTNLEIVEDGIFLHSEQNVAKLNFDGSLVYQEYYAAPKEAGWKRALLYASSIRAAYVGAASYYVSGAMAAAQNDVRQKDEVAGELVSQIGNAYSELGSAASSYAGTAFRKANARLKATKQGRDFLFIMSKQEKDIVLFKISKTTGKIEGEINLGKDREPLYAVDDITGQVYYQTGEAALTSYMAQ